MPLLLAVLCGFFLARLAHSEPSPTPAAVPKRDRGGVAFIFKDGRVAEHPVYHCDTPYRIEGLQREIDEHYNVGVTKKKVLGHFGSPVKLRKRGTEAWWYWFY